MDKQAALKLPSSQLLGKGYNNQFISGLASAHRDTFLRTSSFGSNWLWLMDG